jgi:hypothetical protein
MSQNGSKLPDYMPRRVDTTPNILDFLGSEKHWDIEHSDVLDQAFVVLTVDPKHHMGKDIAVCTVLIGEEQKVMLLNSITLARQLLPLADELPLACKITRKGKRYHFIA